MEHLNKISKDLDEFKLSEMLEELEEIKKKKEANKSKGPVFKDKDGNEI